MLTKTTHNHHHNSTKKHKNGDPINSVHHFCIGVFGSALLLKRQIRPKLLKNHKTKVINRLWFGFSCLYFPFSKLVRAGQLGLLHSHPTRQNPAPLAC